MGTKSSKHKKLNSYKHSKKDNKVSAFVQSQSDLEQFKTLSKSRLNRLSAEIDSLTAESTKCHSLLLPISMRRETLLPKQRCTVYDKTNFESFVDHHPVITKLQNEQNTRVENMEQRIYKIRTSAIRAAERSKFVALHKAKNMHPDHNAERCRGRLGVVCNVGDEDNGDIIPVKSVCKDQKVAQTQTIQFSEAAEDSVQTPNKLFQFGEPWTWLLIPFILPIYVIVQILCSFCTHGYNKCKKKKETNKI